MDERDVHSKGHTVNDSTLSSSDRSRDDSHELTIGLRILCHPSLKRVGDVVGLFDAKATRGGHVRINRTEPEFRAPDGRKTGPLQSARVSRLHVDIKRTGSGGVRVEVPVGYEAWLGAEPLHGAREVGKAELDSGQLLRLGDYILLWLGPLELAPAASSVAELRGDSALIRRLRREILQVADLSIAIMLRGETGVGKELVAAALHQQSQRRDGPYVPINMAAIPASLAAAELFGHGKGAFTGASAPRSGYFVDAHGGTLFLDEIGETAVDVQPLLLRVIETGMIQPLAGKPSSVDVRLIAATDSDLEAAIAEGRFRAPLLRRFGYEIRVPSLRERREDIGTLLVHFLDHEMSAFGEADKLFPEDTDKRPWLRAELVSTFVHHTWPGNVRELRNVARRMAIHNRGVGRPVVDATLLSSLRLTATQAAATGSSPPRKQAASELSDEQVIAALRRNEFSVDPTALDLGVSRSWLHVRMDRLPGLRKAKDVGEQDIRAALGECKGDVKAAAAQLQVSARGLQLQMRRLGLEHRD